ncbi:MAG TPA: hypothetical protein VHW74_00285 [Mycobacteriales bacterium]|nr:hypothetical protein [Mycobacteriales bacterium]
MRRRTISTLALAVIVPAGAVLATATVVSAAPARSAVLPAYPPTPPPTTTPTPTPTVSTTATPTPPPAGNGKEGVTNGGIPITPGSSPRAHAPAKTFNASSNVLLAIHGPGHYTHTYTVMSGPHGALSAAFEIASGAPTGKYSLVARGRHSGNKVSFTSSFFVKKNG